MSSSIVYAENMEVPIDGVIYPEKSSSSSGGNSSGGSSSGGNSSGGSIVFPSSSGSNSHGGGSAYFQQEGAPMTDGGLSKWVYPATENINGGSSNFSNELSGSDGKKPVGDTSWNPGMITIDSNGNAVLPDGFWYGNDEYWHGPDGKLYGPYWYGADGYWHGPGGLRYEPYGWSPYRLGFGNDGLGVGPDGRQASGLSNGSVGSSGTAGSSGNPNTGSEDFPTVAIDDFGVVVNLETYLYGGSDGLESTDMMVYNLSDEDVVVRIEDLVSDSAKAPKELIGLGVTAQSGKSGSYNLKGSRSSGNKLGKPTKFNLIYKIESEQ